MKYTVRHYHTKVLGLTLDEIPAQEEYTEYTIEARDEQEAAVIAHGLYEGYTLEQMAPNPASPCLTIRDRLKDTVKLTGRNSKGQAVFGYDRISGHWITVEK